MTTFSKGLLWMLLVDIGDISEVDVKWGTLFAGAVLTRRIAAFVVLYVLLEFCYYRQYQARGTSN